MSGRSDFYRGETAQEYESKRMSSSIWRREDDVVEALLRDLGDLQGSVVLDIPMGTGRFVRLVEGLGGALVGVDISWEMLEQARPRFQSDVRLAVGSAASIPLRPSSVDVAMCIRFAHLVGRPLLGRTLSELRGVLRDDGVLLIGVRMHSFRAVEGGRRRVATAFARWLRAARFKIGSADSRSHSERWFMRAAGSAGLEVTRREKVTTYGDGSYYLILLMRPGDRRRGRSSSIELVGLPGVGKTTVTRSLLRADRQDLVDGFRAVEDLSVLQCLSAHPFLTLGLAFRLLPVAYELRRDGAKKVTVAALRQSVADKEATGRVIHEEGATHELWRQLMGGEQLSDRFIRKVISTADASVLIEAPVEQLRNRLATKPSPGPISRMLLAEPADGEAWARAVGHYERIKRLLLAGAKPVLCISNTGLDETEAVQRLSRYSRDLGEPVSKGRSVQI